MHDVVENLGVRDVDTAGARGSTIGAMQLSPEEQATFDALQAKLATPDDPAPVIEAAAEVAADVGAATAEAVGEAVAATAEAVAEATDTPPVVIEAPDPIREAEAAVMVIEAEAAADIARGDAAVGRELALHEALNGGDDDEDQDDDGSDGDLVADTFGPIVEELAPDSPPKPAHRWFRPFGS